MIKFRTCILVRPAGVTTEEIVAAFGRVVLAMQECVRLDRVDADFDAVGRALPAASAPAKRKTAPAEPSFRAIIG